jgi:pyrroline-5-carboxylate reductase
MFFPQDAEVAALLQPLGTAIPVQDRHEFLALWSLTALLAPYYGFLAGSAQWAAANGARATTATAFAAASFHALGAMADRPGAPSPSELAQHAQTRGGLNEQVMKELAARGWFAAVGSALDGILQRLEGKKQYSGTD